MSQELKTLNCRLGEDDEDIRREISASEDKTARIKELIRKGITYEKSGCETLMSRYREMERKRDSARSLAYRMSVRHVKEPRPELSSLYRN